MIIKTENAPTAIGPYSQAVKAGNLIFVSGCMPINPKDGSITGETINEQATQMMNNLKAVAEASGHKMSDIVKTTCFISDLENFAAFNAVYAEYFTADSFPARSCVQVARLPKDVLIEVEAIIYLNK